jgi:predicted  nucleic acid-binding Zn-ribbon protein
MDLPQATISESELSRLKAISERLQAISAEQNLQLVNSRKKIDSLLSELAGLSIELSALRDESSALRQSAETSADHSTALQAEVTRLNSLASSLEASFKQYKDEVEREIARLEKSLRFHKFLKKAAFVLALGGWGAWAAATF